VLREAISLSHKAADRIPTPELNKLIAAIVADRPPPQRHGRRLRLYYGAQVGRRPPRFAIQVNDRMLINRDWAFYLENRLREARGLQGVPLVIDYVPRKRSARARARATR
jgi:GTP-binding protein